MKKKIIGSIVIFLLVVTFVTTLSLQSNTVEALSKYGSRGQEVRTIQDKLKRWGYYTGNVDGIYGSLTVSAVKRFQQKNGLKVDGIAGTQTLTAMGITTNSSSGSSTNNSSNVNLLARAIYGEARGETYVGQVAVGAVIMKSRTRFYCKKSSTRCVKWMGSFVWSNILFQSKYSNKWLDLVKTNDSNNRKT